MFLSLRQGHAAQVPAGIGALVQYRHGRSGSAGRAVGQHHGRGLEFRGGPGIGTRHRALVHPPDRQGGRIQRPGVLPDDGKVATAPVHARVLAQPGRQEHAHDPFFRPCVQVIDGIPAAVVQRVGIAHADLPGRHAVQQQDHQLAALRHARQADQHAAEGLQLPLQGALALTQPGDDFGHAGIQFFQGLKAPFPGVGRPQAQTGRDGLQLAFHGALAGQQVLAAAGVTIAHGGRSHPAAPAGKTHVPQIELQVAGALGHKKFHTPHAVPHTDLQLFFSLHQRMGGEEGNMSGTQEGVRRFVHQAERGRGGALAGPDRPGYGDKTHARQQERGPQQAERDTTVSGCLLLHHPVPDFPSQ